MFINNIKKLPRSPYWVIHKGCLKVTEILVYLKSDVGSIEKEELIFDEIASEMSISHGKRWSRMA
jgi:hypothetical protein